MTPPSTDLSLVALHGPQGSFRAESSNDAHAPRSAGKQGFVATFDGQWSKPVPLTESFGRFDGRHGDQYRSMEAPRSTADDATAEIHAELIDDEAQSFLDRVSAALRLIRAGDFRKLVVSRALSFRTDAPVDANAVFTALTQANSAAHVYAVRDGDSLWLGASPELVVAVDGDELLAHPLAGSRPRTGNAAVDEETARELLRNSKDLSEHEAVTQHVAATTRSMLTTHLMVPLPAISHTDTMTHLGTVLRGHLVPGVGSREAAQAVHPTPAIAGVPAASAVDWLMAAEPHLRGVYGGLVGWEDPAGNGRWHLAIRCMQLRGNTVRIVVGAGIVAGSDPQAELAETAAKSRTALSALRHAGVRGLE